MVVRKNIPNIFSPSGKNIKFRKYTSFGNTFIIVYESLDSFENDQQRSYFARWILNGNFGVGGTDNLLFLQCINMQDKNSDYSFRIFEHDGAETLFCGNGLLSVASTLHHSTGRTTFGVKTGLSTESPKHVEIGVGETAGSTWVNLGFPSTVPNNMYCHKNPAPLSEKYDFHSFIISFPNDAEWAMDLPNELTLSGNFIFTGEPHLVFFLGHGLPSELEQKIWLDLKNLSDVGLPDTSQMKMSKALVHYIGSFVNAKYRHLFPQGVHLNFVRISKDKTTVEYRTYERAIDCETLACGSGAVGIANVGLAKNFLIGNLITLKPHRCCWFQPNSKLEVRTTPTGSILYGYPEFIYEGSIPGFL